MFELRLKPLVDAQDVLAQMSVPMHSSDERLFPILPDVNKNDLYKHVAELLEQIREDEFDMCYSGAIRLRQILDMTSETRQILGIMDDLRRRLIDQSERMFCLSLSITEQRLYNHAEPIFGEDVEIAFPMLSEDASEASKCLALQRYTACVSHLMRMIEGAVQALSIKLSIRNPSREWGKLLSDIKPAIELMPLGGIRNAWSENFALLYHVKQAWRNDTMHPKQTYTPEEAQDVFAATRSFIRNLALLLLPSA
jgi:hypothetical protein